MLTSQAHELLALRTVQDFLDENGAKLGTINTGGARKRLDAMIATLSAHANGQDGNKRSAQDNTKQQHVLRLELLRDHMEPIARTARVELPSGPGLEPLRMPKRKTNTEQLVAAAHGMAIAAQPHAAALITAGLPLDFIAELEQKATTLLDTVTSRVKNLGQSAGATTGLRSEIPAARKIVAQLNSFVRSELHDDPALLSVWEKVKRVQRPRSRIPVVVPAPVPTPVVASPAPTPVTPVAATAASDG